MTEEFKNDVDLYIRVKRVGELFGIKPSTVWKWVKLGKLPKPTKLSSRCTVWRLSECQEYQKKLFGGQAPAST